MKKPTLTELKYSVAIRARARWLRWIGWGPVSAMQHARHEFQRRAWNDETVFIVPGLPPMDRFTKEDGPLAPTKLHHGYSER